MLADRKVSREIGLKMIHSFGAMMDTFEFLVPPEVIFFQGLDSFMYNVGVSRCQTKIKFVYYPYPAIFKFLTKNSLYIGLWL